MSIYVRVCDEPCDQCPWKGRLAGGLRPGRLKQIRDDLREHEGVFICHKTQHTEGWGRGIMDTDVADEREQGPAVCSGWLEVGDVPAPLQIAERLGYVREITPP